MAQEEYAVGGGGRSKKSKQQKKAPQRGLGVAQLEKIISEEKQKKDLILGRIGPYAGNVMEAAGGGGGGFIGPCHEMGPKSWVGPIPGQMRSQQMFHQSQRPPPPCSSLVRSSMELPSIQSYHCKNYYALTEEDKMMIGMKRPHNTYSLQSPQSSSLQSKSDEPVSCTNNEQHTPLMEPRNKKLIRESVSNSSPLNNERLNGDFLTLAPPTVASPPLDYFSHHRHELSENEYIPGQEYGESEFRGPGPSGSVENSISFFPIKLQGYQTPAYVSNGEMGETIDLNLKL